LQGNIRKKLVRGRVSSRARDEEEIFFYEEGIEFPQVVPFVATTQDVDPDAQAFLKDTLGNAMVLTRSDEMLKRNLVAYLGSLRLRDALENFARATSTRFTDSAARLAAFLVESAAGRSSPKAP
jgi:hypothetical protein